MVFARLEHPVRNAMRHPPGGNAQRRNDDLFFGINVAGHGTVVQREREITTGDGDAFLLDITADAFAMLRPTCAQFVGLRMPRTAIAPLVRDVDVDTLRLIARTSDSVTLLVSYLGALLKGHVLAAPEEARLVATHVHDLIALTLGATGDATALAEDRSVPAARLRNQVRHRR
jgi:hypothetical protein